LIIIRKLFEVNLASYHQGGWSENKVNMLDLGPLHQKVCFHIQHIIGDPTFLVGPNASYHAGAMDGQEWQSPEDFTAIRKLAPFLPHLKPLLVAFCKGAAETWKFQVLHIRICTWRSY